MSAQDIRELLEEAIRVERNIASLYMLYSKAFPAHADMWRRLSMEEHNHGSMLGALRPFVESGHLTAKCLGNPDINSLKAQNQRVEEKLTLYRLYPPAMQDAYAFAVEIENSTAEINYKNLHAGQVDSKIAVVFQELGDVCSDHASTISSALNAASGDRAAPQD